MEHQDWKQVYVLKNKHSKNKYSKNNTNDKTTKKKGPSNSFDKVDKDEFKIKKVNQTFSNQIKNNRNSKGLTQKELAHKINIKPSVINDYESGKAIPNPAIINKLKRVLEI